MSPQAETYPSAEAQRLQELRNAEERALVDLQDHGELRRGLGGWAPPGGRPHEDDTIWRLVKARKVVLVRDRTRCVLWPGGAS